MAATLWLKTHGQTHAHIGQTAPGKNIVNNVLNTGTVTSATEEMCGGFIVP